MSLRSIWVCLLAVILFSGCGAYREYVRRGETLDSIAVRLERLERRQVAHEQEFTRLRADVLTELEKVERGVGETRADLNDLEERLERIGRRVGAWHGALSQGTTGPVETAAVESAAVPVDTVSLGGVDADRLYNTAYLDFTRGNYRVAIVGFRRFIRLFPSSEMADNAQYWIGECFYSEGVLDSAEVEFQRVVSDYPAGNKVPAAIYKLGLVYQLQGKEVLAQKKFKEVVEKYPGTNEAKLAGERLKPER